MNDNDYIHAGVVLADRWEYLQSPQSTIRTPDRAYYYLCGGKYAQEVLDSLAAQLVRQVDKAKDKVFEGYTVEVCQFMSEVFVDNVEEVPGFLLEEHEDEGRTMNTIKVILDSGVLT